MNYKNIGTLLIAIMAIIALAVFTACGGGSPQTDEERVADALGGDPGDWNFDKETEVFTFKGDDDVDDVEIPEGWAVSSNDTCYTAGDGTDIEKGDQAVEADDCEILVSNENDDEDSTGGQGTGTDRTTTGAGTGNLPPVLHHDDSCPPEIIDGCSFDVGVHDDQVGLAFGVTVAWPEGNIQDQNGRCDLAILSPGWYENLFLRDGRFEVYTIGSDRTGWITNLTTQRADEQTGDYDCPRKSYDDIPVWTSDINSPPDNVNWQQPDTSSNVEPQGNIGQAPAPVPAQQSSCDTVNCQTRRGAGRFEAGEAVYGYAIALDNGQTFNQCWMQSAPSGGNVTDGVVNPWNDEVAGQRNC